MPINAASRSINLSDRAAENHDVQFLVHTRLAVPDAAQINPHLEEHLAFIRSLRDRGILQIGGPFFTQEGKSTGNGFYVLRVDSLDEARLIAADDPLHKSGIRTAIVEPWVQALDFEH